MNKGKILLIALADNAEYKDYVVHNLKSYTHDVENGEYTFKYGKGKEKKFTESDVSSLLFLDDLEYHEFKQETQVPYEILR